jgi:hypothetical protein
VICRPTAPTESVSMEEVVFWAEDRSRYGIAGYVETEPSTKQSRRENAHLLRTISPLSRVQVVDLALGELTR